MKSTGAVMIITSMNIIWIKSITKIFPAFFVVVLAATSVHAEEGGISFGLLPTGSRETMQKIWQPFLSDLSEAIQVTVRPKIYDEYAGVVWGLGADNLQMAWLGNKSAIEAVDRAGAEIAFKIVYADGTEGYWSHLITNVRSGLTCEKEVFSRAEELTFGNGDPNSTSGYVVPGFYLFARSGMEPKAIFKRVTQANHQENLFAVAEGRADVATSNSIDLKRFQTLHPDKFKSIRVIWTSPMIPSDPIVWRKTLPEGLKARIRAFFLDYGRATTGKTAEKLDHERTVLAGMTYSGFAESNDLQLMPIRRLELYRLRSRIAEDPSLSTEQRILKVKELDEKMQMISSQQIEEIQ